MSIDERARHQLFQRLEESLGPDEATTLMELLPPVGWADVGTKHDLAQLEQRIDLRFVALDAKFDAAEHRILESLERGLKDQAHSIYLAMATTTVGAIVAVGGLAFAAARIF